MPDFMLLLPPPPDSNCRVIWGTSHARPARVRSLAEFYRLKMFEKTHVVFCGKRDNNGAVELAIAAVSKWSDLASQCLVVFVIRNLEYEFVHSSKVENPLAFLMERQPLYMWQAGPEEPSVNLKAQVLGIESKLSRRSLNLAVVFASRDQWRESDMFDTPMQESHRALMNVLGHPMEVDETWIGQHTGGLAMGKKCFYSSFRGFEICMHVSSLLSTDERRQYIGNDKVILYICDEGVVKPIVPRFRGEVNSVAVVVQKRETGWKMACFLRDRVEFSPSFPGGIMQAEEVRDHIFTTAIDAQAAVMRSPPYDEIFSRVVQDMVKSVWPELPASKKDRPKSGSFLRGSKSSPK